MWNSFWKEEEECFKYERNVSFIYLYIIYIMFIWVFFHWIMALLWRGRSWKGGLWPLRPQHWSHTSTFINRQSCMPVQDWVLSAYLDTIPKMGFCQHISTVHQRVGFVCIPRHYPKYWVLLDYRDNIPKSGFCWLTSTLCQRLGFVSIPWHYIKDWVLLAYLAGKQCSGCAQTEIQVLSAHNPDYQTFSLSTQNG